MHFYMKGSIFHKISWSILVFHLLRTFPFYVFIQMILYFPIEIEVESFVNLFCKVCLTLQDHSAFTSASWTVYIFFEWVSSWQMIIYYWRQIYIFSKNEQAWVNSNETIFSTDSPYERIYLQAVNVVFKMISVNIALHYSDI